MLAAAAAAAAVLVAAASQGSTSQGCVHSGIPTVPPGRGTTWTRELIIKHRKGKEYRPRASKAGCDGQQHAGGGPLYLKRRRW